MYFFCILLTMHFLFPADLYFSTRLLQAIQHGLKVWIFLMYKGCLQTIASAVSCYMYLLPWQLPVKMSAVGNPRVTITALVLCSSGHIVQNRWCLNSVCKSSPDTSKAYYCFMMIETKPSF